MKPEKAKANEFSSYPELQALLKNTISRGRMGTAREVVNAVAFLRRPKTSCVTGQNIAVDGAVLLRSDEALARRLAGTRRSGERDAPVR